jgi:hypothetical protein
MGTNKRNKHACETELRMFIDENECDSLISSKGVYLCENSMNYYLGDSSSFASIVLDQQKINIISLKFCSDFLGKDYVVNNYYTCKKKQVKSKFIIKTHNISLIVGFNENRKINFINKQEFEIPKGAPKQ